MPAKALSSYRYALPTADEIATSLLLIKKYKDEVHEFAIRIKDLRSMASESSDADVKADFENMIQQLSSEMEDVKKLMAEKESIVSPIRLLPAELLAEVLLCHVLDNGHLPWPLLAVCRSWRYVAIGTPRLWSKIHLKSGPSFPSRGLPPSTHASSYKSGIVCDNYETLELVLTRSGVVPLDIDVDLVAFPVDDDRLELLCGQTGSRWRSVKWQVHGIPDFVKQWEAMSPRLPNLEVVSFGARCDGPTMDAVLATMQATSPSLRALSLESPTALQYISNKTSLLRRIKYIDWEVTPSYHLLDIDACTQVAWLHLGDVQSLRLRGRSTSPFSNCKEGAYGALRTLAVCSWRLDNLVNCAEKLTSLTYVHLESLSGSFQEHENQPHTICLSNVTHFTLINDSYRPLSLFFLPSLVSLELYGNTLPKNDAGDELDFIWNAETSIKAPRPTTALHIEAKANDAYVLAVLRFMDQLKELHLYFDSPTSVGAKLMSSLSIPPKKRVIARGPEEVKKWRAPTCPELERLVVVCKKVPARELDSCLDILSKVSESRLGTASEMDAPKLALYSKSGRGSRNKASSLMENWAGHYDER